MRNGEETTTLSPFAQEILDQLADALEQFSQTVLGQQYVTKGQLRKLLFGNEKLPGKTKDGRTQLFRSKVEKLIDDLLNRV